MTQKKTPKKNKAKIKNSGAKKAASLNSAKTINKSTNKNNNHILPPLIDGSSGENTAGGTKKYKKTSLYKDKARKRYEAGEYMIDIARDMNLNYNTLLSLASKEGWKRGITREWVYTEEMIRIIEENADNRVKIVDEYRDMIARVKELLKVRPLIYMEESVAIANAAKSIETLYKIDKEINHIHSDMEEIEYRKKMIELEKWKKQIEDQANDEEKIVIE